MAIYRTVHVNFWEDSKILDDMNIEERYFLLYLLTNPHTNQVGCFEISKRQMKNETDFENSKINELLNKFENEFNLINYSSTTKEIFIKNWYKYHWSNSPKVLTCIEKEFVKIKDEVLKEKVYKMLEKTYPKDTLSIEYINGIYRVGIKEKEKEKEKENKKNNKNKKNEDELTLESSSSPSLSSIILFGQELGVDENYCKNFFDYYEDADWENKEGEIIKNWKLVFRNWLKKDKKKTNNKYTAPEPDWLNKEIKEKEVEWTDEQKREFEKFKKEIQSS